MDIHRGDIFFMYPDKTDHFIGSEQSGPRPVVIIQNDRGNKYSDTTIIANISTKDKNTLPTHVRLHSKYIAFPSVAMLEQIRTISKQRLGKYIGTLSSSQMKKIDKAICISLGIDRRSFNNGNKSK